MAEPAEPPDQPPVAHDPHFGHVGPLEGYYAEGEVDEDFEAFEALPKHRSIKVKLKGHLKNRRVNQAKIEDAIQRLHMIHVRTSQFLKLYILHRFDEGETAPAIDEVDFIMHAIKVVCVRVPNPPGKFIVSYISRHMN